MILLELSSVSSRISSQPGRQVWVLKFKLKRDSVLFGDLIDDNNLILKLNH